MCSALFAPSMTTSAAPHVSEMQPKRRAADVAYDAIEAMISTLQLQPGSRQSDCAWLLTDTHPRTTAHIDPQQWHWQTQMARPTDRGDFIRIYRRRAATE